MGMNINFGLFRRQGNPYTKAQQEEMKKNIEYVPQELKAQELKAEEEKPGNMQSKTPTTPSKSEIDAFLQNYEQTINDPNISWNG